MTEHLPECPPEVWCICSYLRDCEARVLDAAREAVAEFAPSVWIGLIRRSDAILVIDALRKDAQ
jgi:hypothetical protein